MGGPGVPEHFATLASPQGAEDGSALRVEDACERGFVILHVKRGQKACAGDMPQQSKRSAAPETPRKTLVSCVHESSRKRNKK